MTTITEQHESDRLMRELTDPLHAARQQMHATRRELRGTGNMDAYADMFATYWNALREVRARLLADAANALEGGLPTAAEFAADALEDVRRIDAELACK